MLTLRRSLRWLLLFLLLMFAGCEDWLPQEPPDLETGSVFRTWVIDQLYAAGRAYDERVVSDEQEDGVVDVIELIGPLTLKPPGMGDEATGEVFSNETGGVFWVSAQAPVDTVNEPIGSHVRLKEVFRFRREAGDAELRFTITMAKLEAIDGNGLDPSFIECPWARGPLIEFAVDCANLMMGSIDAFYWAYTEPTRVQPPEAFFYANSTAKLFGWGREWYADVYTMDNSVQPLYHRGNFDVNLDSDGTGRHPLVRLNAPVPVIIPLDSVDVGEEFEVVIDVSAIASNRRGHESYIDAFFRDPFSSSGLEIEFEGLTRLRAPDEIRDDVIWSPPAVTGCEASGPGGTIAFATDDYLDAEWPGAAATILVTRSGGSAGTASVVLTTSDGTATAGEDYRAVTSVLRFADGEEGTRAVAIPMLQDTILEDPETVLLALSSHGGCGTLGRASATLTILDDDRTPPATYTVGGTVSGLEGSGLRLREGGLSIVDVSDNGVFVFPVEYSSGNTYNVTVDTQPGDPLQSCTVTNGAGTITDHDVTDIVVACETPSGAGGLDPSFGTGGQVETSISPDSDDRFATKIALQPDGRLLAVARNMMVRYNADGTPDTGFGANGQVQVQFGPLNERLQAVAVQPDGRILVAGYTDDNLSLPANNDFALARFNADGTPDTGFGVNGVVTTDFAGMIDAASAILILPDGAILLAGSARVTVLDVDFGLARYTSAGVPDSTFGANGDGKATVNLAGNQDLAYTVALQSDGRIIVTGRAALSGGSDPDIGIARFDTNGILDASFGTAGIVRVATAEADWPLDAVIDGSDRILVSGSYSGSAFVARYDANGAPDASFAGGMLITSTLSTANGIALDSAGRILIAGAVNGDMGIVRLLDDGTIDTSFGTNGDGVITVDFYNGNDAASDVAVQPDGRIVAGGVVSNGLQRRVGFVRVLP